jgi:hypothetical protein
MSTIAIFRLEFGESVDQRHHLFKLATTVLSLGFFGLSLTAPPEA